MAADARDRNCVASASTSTSRRPRPAWAWRGEARTLEGLRYPPAATAAQLRNVSVVLAAIERHDPALLQDADAVNELIGSARPPGRFQVIHRDHEWMLDVAHNPQAVATLRAQLETLPPPSDLTIVIGLLR